MNVQTAGMSFYAFGGFNGSSPILIALILAHYCQSWLMVIPLTVAGFLLDLFIKAILIMVFCWAWDFCDMSSIVQHVSTNFAILARWEGWIAPLGMLLWIALFFWVLKRQRRLAV